VTSGASLAASAPSAGLRRGRLAEFVLLTLLVLLVAASVGARSLSLPAFLDALFSNPLAIEPRTQPDAFLLWQLRIPRVLLGALVGAALACAGSVLQSVFRNPLADPGLVGVSMGAALGAVSWIVLGAALIGSMPPGLAPYALPLAAFVGAAAVGLLAMRLASAAGELDTALLLLTGIAMNALAGALIGALVFVADDRQLRDLTFWTMGSLAGANWTLVLPTALFVLLSLAWLLTQARALDRLTLGEREAWFLGVDVPRTKRRLLLTTALIVGAAVAVSGSVGFVGLMTPHLARLAVGAPHRLALPVSCLLGASLVVTADLMARTLALPAELPVGLVTSLIGAPALLFLLQKSRTRRIDRS
jgi:iron complex transport system permease protein